MTLFNKPFYSVCFALITFASAFASTKEYRLDVKDFTELKLNDHLNIEYCCSSDSAGQIYFTCSPDVAQQLLFTSNKNCLNIQVADDSVYAAGMPVIRVYSTMLEKVENGSDSTIRIINNRPVKSFKARVIGNGSIIIDNIEATSAGFFIETGKGHIVVKEGTVYKANFDKVGKGTIEAGNLKASEVKVKALGSGDIDCMATESLSIYGAGTSIVYYSGNPKKVTNRSVGVKAYPINTKVDE